MRLDAIAAIELSLFRGTIALGVAGGLCHSVGLGLGLGFVKPSSTGEFLVSTGLLS